MYQSYKELGLPPGPLAEPRTVWTWPGDPADTIIHHDPACSPGTPEATIVPWDLEENAAWCDSCATSDTATLDALHTLADTYRLVTSFAGYAGDPSVITLTHRSFLIRDLDPVASAWAWLRCKHELLTRTSSRPAFDPWARGVLAARAAAAAEHLTRSAPHLREPAALTRVAAASAARALPPGAPNVWALGAKGASLEGQRGCISRALRVVLDAWVKGLSARQCRQAGVEEILRLLADEDRPAHVDRLNLNRPAVGATAAEVLKNAWLVEAEEQAKALTASWVSALEARTDASGEVVALVWDLGEDPFESGLVDRPIVACLAANIRATSAADPTGKSRRVVTTLPMALWVAVRRDFGDRRIEELGAVHADDDERTFKAALALIENEAVPRDQALPCARSALLPPAAA